MIEQRVFCDKCQNDCSEDYIAVDFMRHSFDGKYATKDIIHLCLACFAYLDRFLDVDFSVPVEDPEWYE